MERKTAFALLACTLLLEGGRGAAQLVDTIAGGSVNDGRPASLGAVNSPTHLVVTSSGDVYVADTGYNRVRRVDHRTGLISTVAGTGEAGYSGDGGPATAARLRGPQGIALDAGGNVFISDTLNHVVRRVDAGSGEISTVVGTGEAGFGGDGGPAAQALLQRPHGLAFSPSGDLIIADFGNRRVRRVSGGVVGTLAGTGANQSSGDAGPATAASLRSVDALLFEPNGDLLVADGTDNRVRRISAATGLITAFAGSGAAGFSGDGGPATAAGMTSPRALARDAIGNVFIADYSDARLRRVSGGAISTVAGSGNALATGDGGPATQAAIGLPSGVAVGPAGEIYIADSSNDRVRVVSGTPGSIAAFVGPPANGDGGPARASVVQTPVGLARSAGKLYVSEDLTNLVRAVDLASGVITTVAGNGKSSGTVPPDGTAATSVPMTPRGLSLDAAGNLYIAAVFNGLLRLNTSTGTISTVVANSNGVSNPSEVFVDGAGNLLVIDTAGTRIRRISAATGAITTVAGTGTAGYSGDGGPATQAMFREANGIAADPAGNVYFADTSNDRVRRVDAATGVITTFAGTGVDEDSGDGGPASAAGIRTPWDLAFAPDGDLLITSDRRVRRVAAATGLVSTVAGADAFAYGGDGGPATLASFQRLRAVAVAADGSVTVADEFNDRVRAISCTVGSPPELSSPANGETTASASAVLTWEAAPFATRYDVVLDTVNPPVAVAARDLTARAFTATGLAPATSYFWSVVARSDPSCPASSSKSSVRSFRTPSACADTSDRQVCLSGDRFLLTGTYRLEGGGSGPLRFTKITSDAAYFVFDNPSDAQALVKVLNVCFEPFNAIWFFLGALTDQEVHLSVTDTKSGTVRSYANPLKTPFRPIQDTAAFRTCP